MYFVINGFDHTFDIPMESINLSLAIGDAPSALDFQVYDPGAQIALDTMQEVIVWDETASAGGTTLAIPAHNILVNPSFVYLTGSIATNFTVTGSLSSLVTFPANTESITFNNNTNGGQAFAQQVTLYGYVHAGQQYMFSATVAGTSPVNIQSVLKLEFLDITNTLIGGATTDIRTPPFLLRIAISATAPATAAYARITLGGQTTSGTNSGTITINNIQLEPMWFLTEGVTYPTPINNTTQGVVPTCVQMPDGTISRYNRLFSGYINDIQASYDGPNRTWSVSCAYADAILDSSGNNGANSQINYNASNSYDADIINQVTSTYFGSLLTIFDPVGSTLVRGIQFTQITYSDMSLKDVLNSIVDASGFAYWISPLYQLYYRPFHYTPAPFTFTSGTPDNATSFSLYEYSYRKDATQRKRQIKVVGSKYIAPAITDNYTGDGSTKIFGTLTQKPYDVKYVQVAGVNKLAGVAGRNTFAQGYAVLVDKINQQMTFNTAPAASASVTINYTYEAPVAVTVLGQDSDPVAVAPAYVAPAFVLKINDTSIGDLTTAIDRGLTEISKYGKARIILDFKATKFVPPGTMVYITISQDNIINVPFTVQTIGITVLGNGINEYKYTVGSYNPTIIDHLRQHHRAIAANTTSAGVTTPQQIDLVFSDTVTYTDTLTIH